jgi:uncharacterized protein YhbP (UPF0306 family)
MSARLTHLRAVGPGGANLPGVHVAAHRAQASFARTLRQTTLGSIATVSPGGRAHANTVYFAVEDGGTIVFLSDPRSHHARNLVRNSSMAMTVFSSRQTWGGPDRGVQLFGTAGAARGALARRAEAAYSRRFRTYARWRLGLRPEDEARTWRFFRFRPRTVKIFDESALGPGVFVVASVRRAASAR